MDFPEIKRFFIFLSYNGAAYHGWQVQPNGISVQEVLAKALSTVLRSTIEVIGAGRTDSGVHARLMVAHFDTEVELPNLSRFAGKLNSILPNDIAIYNIKTVQADAHARFDATSRRYEYHIVTDKSVFRNGLAARFADRLDIDTMNTAAKLLFNYIDFTSFSKLHIALLLPVGLLYHAVVRFGVGVQFAKACKVNVVEKKLGGFVHGFNVEPVGKTSC